MTSARCFGFCCGVATKNLESGIWNLDVATDVEKERSKERVKGEMREFGSCGLVDNLAIYMLYNMS